MTKLYDALRQAEAERQQRCAAAGGTAALLCIPVPPEPPAPDDARADLERLRGIVVGGMARDFARAVTRIERRIEAEWSSLRDELGKLEQSVEDRLAESDARACQGHAELRELLRVQSDRLGDRIKQRSAEVVRLANDGLRELRRSKLDASEFAAFVRAQASRIVDESGR